MDRLHQQHDDQHEQDDDQRGGNGQGIALTWVGGHGNNRPTDAANWNPQHPLQPNENLTLTSGTINLGSGNLAGNVLHIANEANQGDPAALLANAPTVQMTPGGNLKLEFVAQQSNAVKVDVTGKGDVRLDVHNVFPSGPEVFVTADQLSRVLTTTSLAFGQYTQHGGTFVVAGPVAFGGTHTLLDADVSGSGTIAVTQVQSSNGFAEMTRAIGSGVTFAVSGDPERFGASSVTVDQPTADKGTVTLRESFLELKNLADADRVSYDNDLLSVFHDDKLLAAVKVVGLPSEFPNDNPSGVLSFGKDSAGNVFAYNAPASELHADGLTTLPS